MGILVKKNGGLLYLTNEKLRKNEETPVVSNRGNYEKSMCNLTNNLIFYYLFLMKIV